jgi:glutathione S-transferase
MTAMKGLQSQIELPFEQEFELYHNALSLCSMKTRVCLAELQIPYKSHHIDLIETGCYENIRKPFLKINPAGTVPVLVHNGHPVYESHEQIRYAARHAPATSPGLIPESAELASEMERWVDLSSLTDDPLTQGELSAGNAIPGQTLPLFATMIEKIPYRNIFVGFLFHFDKRRPLMFTLMKLRGLQALAKIPPFSKLLALSRKQMHTHLDALETQLRESGGPWILGTFFSLADVSWLVIFERLRQADCLPVFAAADQRPACAAYWEKLKARPSYRQAILEHDHPLIAHGTQRIRQVKAESPAMLELLEGR